ncbi:DEAD/DEAH box helicase [Roseinatronobacter monicus]|uniref:ATP-dependent RNA helicase DeaD n=1 Tax=Roseinatronobacter monicus TaxID=393481 RepID=A0A543KAS5_9RHOB|nr:DEAD/DEAH box helicase [Roseinatronobacter monicus]TQM92142.1 ATP-dependent RNA helicase DeaD [Roseinatronobacter monicus]
MITPLSEALAERGFDKLTPVQNAVTAEDIGDQDLLVSAQTGSGKTVGFGMAIAPTMLGGDDRFGPAAAPLALVVAPTRELAFQVMRELTWLYAKTGAIVTSCVGGMDSRQERRALERGAHIVVGTPGRLRDHIERNALDLSELRAVVLDEADEMLDMGFREDLEFMLGKAPAERRTLMFSATVSPMIAKLAKQYQRDARRISTLGSTDQHADISYQALRVAASDSEHAIFNLLRFHADQSAIVFCNTRAAVSHLSARLTNRGLATVTLSGELSQTERTHALQAMRDGRARVCVATDVAARGIDLPNLNLVIHADLPTNTESLLHRSGRTGRAGRKGISALIVPPRALRKAENLLKWSKISAEWTVAPSVEDILQKDEERLLADPAWTTPLTEDEQTFAAKLLALHAPEVVAAAYLRLYQQRNAAPEDLLPPEAKPAAREHKAFGPSRWFALSVGRDDKAEPRWILPLLCRAGNLDKTAIGAIRVQDNETHVELTEASAAGFMTALGAGGVLEDGIVARPMETAPDRQSGGGGRPKSDSGPRPRPEYRGSAPASRARTEGAPERKAPAAPRADGERKPRHSAATSPAPRATSKPDAYKPKDKADAYKPKEKFDAPRGKDSYKPKDKPDGPRAKAKFDRYDPAVKPAGKPASKSKPKPMGKPSAPAADARDSSKRFTPPGAAKPAARKPRATARPGGAEPPKRGKR